MAQQSARRDRKNQRFPPCKSTLRVMWFRSANSHTGPQLSSLHQEAGQMAASDYASKLPQNTACVFRGVHRWKADIGALTCAPHDLAYSTTTFSARRRGAWPRSRHAGVTAFVARHWSDGRGSTQQFLRGLSYFLAGRDGGAGFPTPLSDLPPISVHRTLGAVTRRETLAKSDLLPLRQGPHDAELMSAMGGKRTFSK